MGLLLLRAVVGITATIQGCSYVADSANQTLGTFVIGMLSILCGTALFVGILTPVVGCIIALVSAGTAFSWFPPPTPNLFDAALPTVFAVIVAIAVTFLGPGAVSLDARLFGRREIIIPRTSHSAKP